MSTVSGNDLNLKIWNGATDGDYDAVVAAIAAGVDVNWKNNSEVSDNDILIVVQIVDHRLIISYICSVYCS